LKLLTDIFYIISILLHVPSQVPSRIPPAYIQSAVHLVRKCFHCADNVCNCNDSFMLQLRRMLLEMRLKT